MTKLDEMIDEIADTFCGSAGCDSMGHGPGGCGLSKELRKFAADVASAMLVRRNWTGEGIDWVSGYRTAFRDAKQNASRLGVGVE